MSAANIPDAWYDKTVVELEPSDEDIGVATSRSHADLDDEPTIVLRSWQPFVYAATMPRVAV